MKKLTLFSLMILAAIPATAAPKWLRYTGAAAVCAASAMDGYTTAQGGPLGLKEINPLLRGANGAPSMPKVIAFKAAMCGVAVWRAHSEKGSDMRLGVNLAVAGIFSTYAIKNQILIDRMIAAKAVK